MLEVVTWIDLESGWARCRRKFAATFVLRIQSSLSRTCSACSDSFLLRLLVAVRLGDAEAPPLRQGGCAGVRRNTCMLCAFVTATAPRARFTTVAVLSNCRAPPHVDSHNFRDEPTLLIALTGYKGGQVWVEFPVTPVERTRSRTEVVNVGNLIDLQQGPA